MLLLTILGWTFFVQYTGRCPEFQWSFALLCDLQIYWQYTVGFLSKTTEILVWRGKYIKMPNSHDSHPFLPSINVSGTIFELLLGSRWRTCCWVLWLWDSLIWMGLCTCICSWASKRIFIWVFLGHLIVRWYSFKKWYCRIKCGRVFTWVSSVW